MNGGRLFSGAKQIGLDRVVCFPSTKRRHPYAEHDVKQDGQEVRYYSDVLCCLVAGIYVCVCVYMCVCVCVWMSMCVRMSLCVCVSGCMCVHTFVYMSTCLSLWMDVYIPISIYLSL